ncbi:hypothetical protein TL16_g08918 [Triparma laevis f. inornata]|uniref:Uncharacterized protein n=1 Tax=Triparma laevis f. inornata TaxID=1714386 RepID=A0A9W7B896_9STRA|nr:hypothetical protein TL16_g08918 [Triparma laevis f. inornata]
MREEVKESRVEGTRIHGNRFMLEEYISKQPLSNTMKIYFEQIKLYLHEFMSHMHCLIQSGILSFLISLLS